MIIGIAGPIASGKSTLARALVKKFSLKLIGFGEFVRHEAKARGMDATNRRVLQELGQSLVDEDVAAFVHSVFARADFRPADGVVMDGIRHENVWREVVAYASLHGSTARLIYLDMPDEDRHRRLEARGISSDQSLAQDLHASEADVHNRLANQAELRLDALRPEDDMLATIAAGLELD